MLNAPPCPKKLEEPNPGFQGVPGPAGPTAWEISWCTHQPCHHPRLGWFVRVWSASLPPDPCPADRRLLTVTTRPSATRHLGPPGRASFVSTNTGWRCGGGVCTDLPASAHGPRPRNVCNLATILVTFPVMCSHYLESGVPPSLHRPSIRVGQLRSTGNQNMANGHGRCAVTVRQTRTSGVMTRSMARDHGADSLRKGPGDHLGRVSVTRSSCQHRSHNGPQRHTSPDAIAARDLPSPQEESRLRTVTLVTQPVPPGRSCGPGPRPTCHRLAPRSAAQHETHAAARRFTAHHLPPNKPPFP